MGHGEAQMGGNFRIKRLEDLPPTLWRSYAGSGSSGIVLGALNSAVRC